MRFAHTNIAAKNWKHLSDFYINVFNCRIKPPERNLSGDWLDRATGLKKARLAGVHLLLPGHGDNGPTLEIFTYEDTCESAPIMANNTGFTHIAFEVEDVDATLKTALSNGAGLLGEITEKEIKNIGLLKFVYFRDPEGNIIEIQSWKK
ncbi:MAG: VOC family protein [Desulfobacteraceae bacterium]|nr:MAG: VOC family protein [Desulfobacteraceae bacterium]